MDHADTNLESDIKQKFQVSVADFKSLNDDLKLNIKLKAGETGNDLLTYLTSKAQVNHFNEVIPSANDIFIETVRNN